MKNGGQQKCLDKALLIVKHEDVNIIIKKFHCGMISQNMLWISYKYLLTAQHGTNNDNVVNNKVDRVILSFWK